VISVVTFLWQPRRNYRSQFGPEHVNTLARMVARHYKRPHRFIVVSDTAEGIDNDLVEIVPLWDDFADLPSPHGAANPSCYRRLKMYAPEMAEVFGPRVAIMDLDCVVTDDLCPIFDCPQDFRIWGMTNPNNPYNGSLTVMDTGARPQVWTDFDPVASPAKARQMGYYGSDQAWLCACLGPDEARFGRTDGVYSFRVDLQQGKRELPHNARIVFFHGSHDPWREPASRLHWVQRHYR